jgi:hypothetical protein
MVVRVDDYGDFDDTGAMGESSIKCLTLEPDGWLVLYDINGHPVRKWGPGAGHLNVQHNGHVVLYTASDKAIVATDWYLLRGKPIEHGGPSFRDQGALPTVADGGSAVPQTSPGSAPKSAGG